MRIQPSSKFTSSHVSLASSLGTLNIPVEYHRVGVTEDQVEELNLAEDFNPAKESSTRFKSFLNRTGSNQTWELEALPPEYLQEQLRLAIEANMDSEILTTTKQREAEELRELQRIRGEIVTSIR